MEYKHCGEPTVLSKILSKKMGLSRRLITKLKETDGILVDGTPKFTNYLVQDGQTVSVVLPKESSPTLQPEQGDLRILYEDDFVLAADKPSGIPVHPTLNFKSGTLANFVMYHYKDTPFTFRPVNRLDKDTSGIVLIAKNQFAAAHLSEQLKQNQIEKVYHAIVCGEIPDTGEIDSPIERCPDSIIKRQVSQNGKPALTKYRKLNFDGTFSLAEVIPVTGRTHQIRLHFAHIGHPLKGDFLYGTELENQTFFLRCVQVTFTHPQSGEKIKISSS